jgi:hypothetical protein
MKRVWVRADGRRRPKRIAKKMAKRAGLQHHLPPGFRFYESLPFSSQYVLSRCGKPYLAPCLGAGAAFFRTHDRRVGWDEDRERTISTVFLGIDHSHDPRGRNHRPVLWETMVFPKDSLSEECCFRYTSQAAARKGHALVCEAVADGLHTGEAIHRAMESVTA